MVSKILPIFVLFLSFTPQFLHGAENVPPLSSFDDFLRYIEFGKDSAKVETSIVTYTHRTGVEVDLIGAVHVGERHYYRNLEAYFKTCDVLLYEMVKPTEVAPNAARESQSGVSMIQRLMKNALKLEFQLDAIDYSAKNFVHADMTPAAFTKAQEQKGESLSGLMVQAMMAEQAHYTPGEAVRQNLRFLAALTNKNRNHALKMFLGKQIGDMERTVLGINQDKEGENAGTVLLEGRNKVAIKVLRKSLKNPKNRKIGIFYGAAHMPDMEKRLLQMGFSRQSTHWLTAWDMTNP